MGNVRGGEGDRTHAVCTPACRQYAHLQPAALVCWLADVEAAPEAAVGEGALHRQRQHPHFEPLALQGLRGGGGVGQEQDTAMLLVRTSVV